MKKGKKILIIVLIILFVLGLVVPYLAYRSGFYVVSNTAKESTSNVSFGEWLKAYYQNSCRIEKPKTIE